MSAEKKEVSFEQLQEEFTGSEIQCVVIDTLPILRISKHTTQCLPDVATGILVGNTEKGVIEVTNAFPNRLTQSKKDQEEEVKEASAQEDAVAKRLANYALVNKDDFTVGWYTNTFNDTLFGNERTVVEQLRAQESNGRSIMLVFDNVRTACSSGHGEQPLNLKAYRLKPSFFESYHKFRSEGGDEKTLFSIDALIRGEITFRDIYEEIPVFIRPAVPAAVGIAIQRFAATEEMRPERDLLDTIVCPTLEKSMEASIASMTRFSDDHQQKFRAYAYRLNRYKNKLRQMAKMGVADPKAESPDLPRQIPGMLASAQMDMYQRQISEEAAESASKLYLVHDIISK